MKACCKEAFEPDDRPRTSLWEKIMNALKHLFGK